jgi:hypothetical protein
MYRRLAERSGSANAKRHEQQPSKLRRNESGFYVTARDGFNL